MTEHKVGKMFTYIDLFAGCGGLSLGLRNAGWNGIFAIEKSPDAFATLKHNLIDKHQHFDWPGWLPQKNHDIKKILKDYRNNLINLRGKIDMVTGGPPCQGFSTAGKRDEKDKRNSLIKDYIKFIEQVRPKVLFFENVKGFTLGFNKNKTKGKQYSTFVIEQLKSLGYDVCGDMIDFSKFGVPQKRCRFILVGVRQDISKQSGVAAEDFFENILLNRENFLVSKNLQLSASLEDAISDLLRSYGEITSPDAKKFKAGLYAPVSSNYQQFLRKNMKTGTVADSHRFVNHKEHIEKRFREILRLAKRNTSISDELKRKYHTKKRTIVPLSGTLPSPTITTLPDDYIHYSEARILTVREYARIQSFPDDFEIKGKYTTGGNRRTKEVPRYTQIGNAIPPLFGEQSGVALKRLINGEREIRFSCVC
jgi:DNA (cytosine-5)-methyltransferase 1